MNQRMQRKKKNDTNMERTDEKDTERVKLRVCMWEIASTHHLSMEIGKRKKNDRIRLRPNKNE